MESRDGGQPVRSSAGAHRGGKHVLRGCTRTMQEQQSSILVGRARRLETKSARMRRG